LVKDSISVYYTQFEQKTPLWTEEIQYEYRFFKYTRSFFCMFRGEFDAAYQDQIKKENVLLRFTSEKGSKNGFCIDFSHYSERNRKRMHARVP
jgi:hypothetical protein